MLPFKREIHNFLLFFAPECGMIIFFCCTNPHPNKDDTFKATATGHRASLLSKSQGRVVQCGGKPQESPLLLSFQDLPPEGVCAVPHTAAKKGQKTAELTLALLLLLLVLFSKLKGSLVKACCFCASEVTFRDEWQRIKVSKITFFHQFFYTVWKNCYFCVENTYFSTLIIVNLKS